MTQFKKAIIKKQLWLLFFIIFLFSGSITEAQNKVVVIPLFDDQKTPKTGCIHVYDANDQYLGIYAGVAPGAGMMIGSIFIPTIKLFIIFERDPGDPDYGNVYRQHYSTDSMGNIKLWQKDRLIRTCDNKYVAGVGNPLYTTIYGDFDENCNFREWGPNTKLWRYDYREVLMTEIPFSLPVAMPLRYDLQAPTQ